MNSTALPILEVFPMRPWILFSYCIISVAGIVGNMFVILVISRHEDIGAPSFRIYIISLAIADFFVTLFCIPIYITSISNFHNHPTGLSGKIMCKLLSGYTFPFHFARINIFVMVAISVQRYYAICKPLSPMANPSPRKAKLVVCGIWLGSIFLLLHRIICLEYARNDEATVGAHCKFKSVFKAKVTPKVIYMLTTMIEFIIPIGVMMFCFVKIKKSIANQFYSIKVQEVSSPEHEFKRVHSRQQAVVTVFIVVVSFVILLAPNQILYFCFNFEVYHTSWNSNLYQTTVVLYFFTSCINPVIYVFRSKLFRVKLRETLLCWRS